MTKSTKVAPAHTKLLAELENCSNAYEVARWIKKLLQRIRSCSLN